MKRLEQIFRKLGEKPTGKKCKGMGGLIEEGKEMIGEENLEGEALDAGLISAAQRVEHYEIAAYGCVRTYATLLVNRKPPACSSKRLARKRKPIKSSPN